MPAATEHLIEQYYQDRLALARLSLMQEMETFIDANLTMHELRAILLVTSGRASTIEKLSRFLGVPENSTGATVENLLTHGYLVPTMAGRDEDRPLLVPTEQATELFTTIIDRRDSAMEILTTLDPHDLEALVRGTHALRAAIEREATPITQ